MRLSRRRFLTTLSGAASMALLAPQTSAAGTATGSPSVTFYDRYLIVNADDLGGQDASVGQPAPNAVRHLTGLGQNKPIGVYDGTKGSHLIAVEYLDDALLHGHDSGGD